MEDASVRESASRPRGRFALRPLHAWFLVVVAAAVAGDQVTKAIIRMWGGQGEVLAELGPLRIIHVTNSGAAFGMFQDAGPLLIITSVVGMTAILVYLFNPGFAHPLMRLGLALMLGGAIGNLIDRLHAGEVVDFIKVPNFPAFNVADSCITIGVLVMIWAMLREETTERDAENS